MQLGERNSVARRHQVLCRDKPNSSALTPAQTRVFKLIAEELSNKEIASRMNIGLCTVKAHASAIFSRLELRNREEAKAYFKRDVVNET